MSGVEAAFEIRKKALATKAQPVRKNYVTWHLGSIFTNVFKQCHQRTGLTGSQTKPFFCSPYRAQKRWRVSMK